MGNSLDELAVIAKKAAIRAKDDLLSGEERQKALLEKQTALTELISLLMEQLQTMCRPNSIDSSNYIYEEALQEVFLYICKNIDKYELGKPFFNWFLFLLKKRRIDVFNWINWHGNVTSIYYTDSEKSILDKYSPPNINPLPVEELIAFIKEDPEGLLSRKLFKNNSKASFQAILLKRSEEKKSWIEIVKELDLGNTPGPVSTFYSRCCQEFAPYFKRHLYE